MASLRRPSQFIPAGRGPPPIPRDPVPPTTTSAEPERRRDARKSRVGDAIKRRMSMRYAGPDQLFSGAPPVPGVPGSFSEDAYQGLAPQPTIREDEEEEEEEIAPSHSQPTATADAGGSKFGQFSSPQFSFGGNTASGRIPSGGKVGDEAIRRRGAVDTTREDEWDFEEFGKEGFDIPAYIKRTLTGADEEEKKRFRAALERYKQQNAKELQRNVFKNYAEFVTISKEISTLENDMLELKDLLNQWKDLPQLMGMDATLAPTLDKSGNIERKRTLRNSVLDLQQLYRAQITTLWSTVEGSQKYLPLVAGRHLVFETHNFVELNPATYKAKQSVSLFLLSDLLLIAGRRRTKGATTTATAADEKGRERGRMVAERCWVLADLVVIDVKDSGDLTNALKIRRGKEVCVYRTSKSEDKKALLAAFRQVSQELSEKKRKDSEKEQERRRTMWHGDSGNGSGSANGQDKAASLLSPNRPLSMIGGSLADSKDLRWIDDFGDELTMAIATRDWEEAVEQVEKGEELLKIAAPNPAALALLTTRMNHLRPSLIQSLSSDLAFPDIRKAETIRLVHLLVRLDRAQLARDSLLGARHESMLRRVRAIRAEGDISLYVSELAVVCFTVIRNTGDWYMSAFKENKMASGFVTWAKQQIELFAELFRRQVYAPNVSEDVAQECIRVTASHNRKLLRDVGLDFTFLLTTLLPPPGNASSSTALPTFSLGGPTPAGPQSSFQGHYDLNSPFAGYTIPQTPFDTGATPLSARTQEVTSPSDVLQDYAYGYDEDEEPPRSAKSITAPLSINRRGKTPGEGGSGNAGRRPGLGESPAGGRQYSEGESPGGGAGMRREGSDRQLGRSDMGKGQFEDGDEDLR